MRDSLRGLFHSRIMRGSRMLFVLALLVVGAAQSPTSAMVRDNSLLRHATGSETLLHAFRCCKDGTQAMSPLFADKHGALFGTTYSGGSTLCGDAGCGIIYKLIPASGGYQERILHSFQNAGDGSWPQAGLIADQAGVLYGTTTGGGGIVSCEYSGCGTIFSLRPDGADYQVLYRFVGGTDGSTPAGGLVADAAGNLYGTTSLGGNVNCYGDGCGTVFKLTRNGSTYSESVIYSFTNSNGDGGTPMAGLFIDAGGALYGTTLIGGTFRLGTVFRLTPSGSSYREAILYSFGAKKSDGVYPEAGLIQDTQGSLYGTTSRGGRLFLGTVFKLTPNGSNYSESVLHHFEYAPDGYTPLSSLTLDASGALYGTTSQGGAHALGAIIKLTPSAGKYHEKVLYSFTDYTKDGRRRLRT